MVDDLAPAGVTATRVPPRAGRARDAKKYLQDAMVKVDADVALQNRAQMKRNIERELKALPR